MPKPISILAILIVFAFLALCPAARAADTPGAQDWKALDAEALGYYRTYLRFDTTNPPDNTVAAINYLKSILDQAGIDNQTFVSTGGAMSLVARLPGPAGVKPLLLMSHADVVPRSPPTGRILRFPPTSTTATYGRAARSTTRPTASWRSQLCWRSNAITSHCAAESS